MNDALPGFEQGFQDILEFLATSTRPLTRAELIAMFGHRHGLEESQLNQTYKRSNFKIVTKRVEWATVYFREAGLLREVGVSRRNRKLFAITEPGLKLHAKICNGEVAVLDRHYLYDTYTSFRVYRHRTRSADEAPTENMPDKKRLDSKYDEVVNLNRKAIRKELGLWLDALGQVGMENLAGKLFECMGYMPKSGELQSRNATLIGTVSYENSFRDLVHAMVRHDHADTFPDLEQARRFHSLVESREGRGLLLSNRNTTDAVENELRSAGGLVNVVNKAGLCEMLVSQRMGVVADTDKVLFKVDRGFLNAL